MDNVGIVLSPHRVPPAHEAAACFAAGRARIVAVAVTGCGSSDAKGLPVHVVNESAWDAHVFGCPGCGKLGVVVEGEPDRKPSESGGTLFGWTEGRAWPRTYKVVVRGVQSVCPFIDPHPAKAKGTVGTRDVIYVVDQSGKCVEGPGSMDWPIQPHPL